MCTSASLITALIKQRCAAASARVAEEEGDYKDWAAAQSEAMEQVVEDLEWMFGVSAPRIPCGYTTPRKYLAWDMRQWLNTTAALLSARTTRKQRKEWKLKNHSKK